MTKEKHEKPEEVQSDATKIIDATREATSFVDAMTTLPEDVAHDKMVRERSSKPIEVTEDASEIRKMLFKKPYGEFPSFHAAMDTSGEAMEDFMSNLEGLAQERSPEEIHEMLLIAAETDHQVAFYMASQMKTGETIADLKKEGREGFKSFREAMRDFKAFGDFIRKWYFMQINEQFKEEGHPELMRALLIEAASATTENAEFFLGKRLILGDQPEYDLKKEIGDETYDAVMAAAHAKISA